MPSDLLEWCCQKIEEIAATSEGTTAVRLGHGLCKPLVEEVYPLAIWATNSESVAASAIVTPCIGSQAYDAVVADDSHHPVEYFVEVTQAHMGQTEHFRMLHLEREGWAPGPLSEMKRIGSRRSGSIQPGRVMDSMTGHVRKTTDLVKEAISRKLGKDYNQPIVLVVAFEDFIVRNDEYVVDVLENATKEMLKTSPSPFTEVFLVGMSGHLLLEVTSES